MWQIGIETWESGFNYTAQYMVWFYSWTPQYRRSCDCWKSGGIYSKNDIIGSHILLRVTSYWVRANEWQYLRGGG